MKENTLKKKQYFTTKKDTGKMTVSFQTILTNTYRTKYSKRTISIVPSVIPTIIKMKRANTPTTVQVTAVTASITTTHIVIIVMNQYEMNTHITQRSHKMITVIHVTLTATDTATDAAPITG